MKLKSVYDTEGEVPEQYKGLFVLRGGKWVLDGIEGLATSADIHKLTTALATEKAAHTATKEKYAPIADRDVSEIVAELDRIPELEAQASGSKDVKEQVDKAVEARVKTIQAQHDRMVKDLTSKLAASETQLGVLVAEQKQGKISAAITAAAKEMNVREANVEDAILYCSRLLDIDPTTNNILTKDGVGVTPGLDPVALLRDLRDKKGWWETSVGAGLTGGKGSTIGNNPWDPKTLNLTQQSAIYKDNPARAKALAAAVGIVLED